MDSHTYRREMERRFNAVMIPVLAAFVGVAAVTVLSVRFEVDPKSVFAVALLCVCAVGGGLMYWWNFTVVPKEREMKERA